MDYSFNIIKIGIVYSTFYKSISNDDKVLIRVIEKNPNLEYSIFNWDQNNSLDLIKKKQFQFLLIRNTWVIDHSESFQNWLERVKNNTNVLILNDLEMVKWNFSKIYLKELRDEYLINIIPSLFIKKDTILDDLKSIIKRGLDDGTFTSDTSKFVYKPAIGSEGFGVESFTIDNHCNLINDNSSNCNHLHQINQLLKKSDVLIQPFLKSIIDEGEYSFIFFNSRFSHSAIKTTPNKNEFKVQNGGLKRIKPNSNDLDIAKSISKKLSKKFNNTILYTRIDMIRYNNILCLNEMDIVEPNLYFLNDESLALNFLDSALKIYYNYQSNQNQNQNNNDKYYSNK